MGRLGFFNINISNSLDFDKDETKPKTIAIQNEFISPGGLTSGNNHIENQPNQPPTSEPNPSIEPITKSYCPEEQARKWILALVISISVVAVVTIISESQRQNNTDDFRPTTRALVSNCTENGAVGRIGELVCFTPKQSCFLSLSSELLQNVTIKQILSEYNNFESKDSLDIVIPEEKISTEYQGWIIDYNASSIDQPLRIGKTSLTCQDIGEYNITLHYIHQQDESCTFNMDNSYPEIELSTNETEDFVYINCTMSNVCSEATLAVYINDGNHTYPVLAAENNCHSNTSMKRKEIALQKSQFSSNHKVICKPLIDDINLMENLTKTIPLISRRITLCNESQCPNFCTIEEQGYYFQHPMFCSKFYQCEYPTLHLRPCPENQQWNPEMCTCTLANEVIDQCNNATKKYDPVLATGNVKMCGGS